MPFSLLPYLPLWTCNCLGRVEGVNEKPLPFNFASDLYPDISTFTVRSKNPIGTFLSNDQNHGLKF